MYIFYICNVFHRVNDFFCHPCGVTSRLIYKKYPKFCLDHPYHQHYNTRVIFHISLVCKVVVVVVVCKLIPGHVRAVTVPHK